MEGLGRVVIIVTIDFEETEPVPGPSARAILRDCPIATQHGAFETAGDREGSAEQGDRITYDISAEPAC